MAFFFHLSEPLKAVECFTEASQGVAIEPFFCQKLMQTEETEVRKQEVLYYLKVHLMIFDVIGLYAYGLF